jgi:glyoxylase-like metal-dependent hydrolase (beta-lactamase superfamily II)/rhodanese-related sulfurtransferase
VLFRQFVDEDLGCGSYLIGDPDSGEAVVVDPALAIEQYLQAAFEAGLSIARILETHTHADHVSGHGRFALEHGVPVAIHPIAEPDYPFDALADGQVVEVGSVHVRVVHTPGHRPEHCAFVVDEKMVLTGDSLFVGDAARPDLAVAAREGAQDLFHSLGRLSALGDDVAVYPGHVAGSLCGAAMSPERSTTIGHERKTNVALAYDDEQEFVLASSSVSTPRPPTTERVVEINRGPFVALPSPPVELPDARGARVLDVRPFADHASGHLPGALSVPLDGGSFGTKAGFILELTEPVVLHARSAAEAAAAAWKLWAVGIFDIAGYVLETDVSETLPTVEVDALKRLLDNGSVQLIDVREAYERDEGYIPGSRNIPYRLLRHAGADALDPDLPVVTICESGPRAAIAASVLQSQGFDARPVVGGGIPDFDGETVTFRRCGGAC